MTYPPSKTQGCCSLDQIVTGECKKVLGLELALSSSPVFHKKMSTWKFKFDKDLKV